MNIFNQVGLIALGIFGEPLNSNGGIAGSSQPYQELEYETKLDKETLRKLRMMEKALERAETTEDYNEAQKLNEAIKNLKRIGVQLQKLEQRKKIAVKNKDYESAMVLKKVTKNSEK